jgi:hypothetical protein
MLKLWVMCGVFVFAGAFGTQITLAAAPLQVEGTPPVRHSKATLLGPITWGSPDQPYGKSHLSNLITICRSGSFPKRISKLR